MPWSVPPFAPSPELVPESERFRAHALECRVLAGYLRDEFARDHVLKAAADFDRIARDEKEREIAHGMVQIGVLMRGLHGGG
jgi:hypothetical protein